jgi:hypothetical protein
MTNWPNPRRTSLCTNEKATGGGCRLEFLHIPKTGGTAVEFAASSTIHPGVLVSSMAKLLEKAVVPA